MDKHVLDAKRAREMAEAVLNVNHELEHALRLITVKAKEGKFGVTIYIAFRDDTLNELSGRGFKLESHNNDRKEIYAYTISW